MQAIQTGWGLEHVFVVSIQLEIFFRGVETTHQQKMTMTVGFPVDQLPGTTRFPLPREDEASPRTGREVSSLELPET